MHQAIRTVLCALLLTTMIPLAAQAAGPNVALPLAQPLQSPGLRSVPTPTNLRIVKRDSDLGRNFNDLWASGDQAGLLQGAEMGEYPLAIQAVSCQMACLGSSASGSTDTVWLQARIYAVDPDPLAEGPGALLASSAVIEHDLAAIRCVGWVTMTLSSPLTLDAGEHWIAAVAYHSGAERQTPSLVTDASYDIPPRTAFYQRDQAWHDHYAFWNDPANIGYPMIRTIAQPIGRLALYREQIMVAAADTMLSSGQPGLPAGTQQFLLAGNYSDSTYGALRALVRFAELVPPDPRAVLRQASLSVSNYQAISTTAPSAVHVYQATSAWQESSATWQSEANNAGVLVSSANIAGRVRPGQLYGNGYLTFDVLDLARGWFDAPQSNFGVMLRGDEQTPSSGQYLRSREYGVYPAFRPRLTLLWEWPAPAPTVDPSQIVKRRLPLVLK